MNGTRYEHLLKDCEPWTESYRIRLFRVRSCVHRRCIDMAMVDIWPGQKIASATVQVLLILSVCLLSSDLVFSMRQSSVTPIIVVSQPK